MKSSSFNRYRTLRKNASIRNLVAEYHVCVQDLICPLFVHQDNIELSPIASMPGYYRMSLDRLKQEVIELYAVGIQAVLLFVKVPDSLKDNAGTEALNPDGLMQQAIKAVKAAAPEMIVFSDVALDPYSEFGHDGIVENKKIANDKTIEILAKMALTHAQAGADFVAPSDMMDGRIAAIRNILETNHLHDTGILSYSAKYASAFYGPFRDALDSAPGFGNKKTYQMDVANRKEALKETLADIDEGADMVMIKPGLPYLDIVSDIHQNTTVPVAVYQVSGEYAMLKAAAQNGWLSHDACMMETLLCLKRAGANLIATYFAKEAATWLKNNSF